MKKLSLILLAFSGAIFLSGCSTTNIAELTKTLAGDPAIVSAQVNTIYGTAKLSRVGSVTNCLVTVSPDGTITVDGRMGNTVKVSGTATVTPQ